MALPVTDSPMALPLPLEAPAAETQNTQVDTGGE